MLLVELGNIILDESGATLNLYFKEYNLSEDLQYFNFIKRDTGQISQSKKFEVFNNGKLHIVYIDRELIRRTDETGEQMSRIMPYLLGYFNGTDVTGVHVESKKYNIRTKITLID